VSTLYVSDPVHPAVLEDLRTEHEVHVGFGPSAVRYDDVCTTVDAVLLRAEQFTRDKIEASPRLRIIARHGVGTNNVDLDAARENGVWVTITPGGNSRAVAEHALALMLALARRVPEAARHTREGRWTEAKDVLTGVELQGRTLGLVGFGHIGRRVAELGRAFGMHVVVSDPAVSTKDVEAVGGRLVDLEELLQIADVLSLHAPLLPSTHHIIGPEELGRMKVGAFVVNTSRGGLIDERALVDALRSGQLAGAALDVIEGESADMRHPLAHSDLPGTELDNLILTPHVGGQTEEALRDVGDAAARCIRAVLSGRVPDNAVVTPEATAV
jgi:D-3-phosphoglycerate dehydrogenase